MSINDYATELANLKKAYSSAAAGAQGDIGKQGMQLRQKAYGAGIDLNALEDAANGLIGQKVNPNDSSEQAFRNSTFNTVKSAPTFNNPVQQNAGKGGTTNTVSTQFRNEDLEKAHQMMTQLEQIMSKPFTYNPDTDPLVAGARENAAKRAKLADQDMMEEMNSRGILNSTVTSDRSADIHNQSEDQVTAMLPQFQQMAFNQHQSEISNLASLMNTRLNAGIDERNFETETPMREAALTGQYLPGEAKGLIDQIVSLKNSAENPLVTSEQLGQFKNQADTLRQKLSGFGIDADALFGFDVDAKDAAANASKAGRLTVDSQKALVNSLLGLTDAYGAIPKGVGQQIGQLPLFGDLGETVSGLEGKPTMQQKQFDLTTEKFAFDKASTNESQKIQWANQKLGEKRFDQDQTKLQNDERSKAATNGYLTQLLSKGSREEAMAYLVDHAESIVGDNANIQAILDNIDAKFPKPSSASGSTSKDNSFDINKTALEMAQKDIVRWSKAKTPEAQEALINEYRARLTAPK